MLAVRAKRTATAALTAGRFDEGGVYGRMRLLAQACEKKMGLFCLTEEQAKAFEIEPEIVMGLHVARVEPSKGERELALTD
jgi:hypothetical protein